MTTFMIDPLKNNKSGLAFEPFYVDAEDHDEAATKAAKKMFGDSVFGKRNSGAVNGSGMYQAYYNMAKNQPQMNSCGYLFHVMEA